MRLFVNCVLFLLLNDCLAAINLNYATKKDSSTQELEAQQGPKATFSRFAEMALKPDANFKNSRNPTVTTNFSRVDFPCPDAASISPCECSVDDNDNVTLECTRVESQAQLESVFLGEFPVKQLYQFTMANNSAIKVLANFTNGVRFERVNLEPGPFVLETITENFLLSQKDTLNYLNVYHSNLTTDLFPFTVLPEMLQLETLRFYGSNFDRIPPVRSPKLSTFLVNYSPVERLLNGTITIGVEATYVYLFYNQITAIEPGSITFTDAESAASRAELYISLGQNQIQSLLAMTFPLRNAQTTLYLANNQVASIEPGTFVPPETTDSFTILFFLHDNELTTLDEAVFGDVMPFTTGLIVYNNPFTCGCDIAWLVLNPALLAKVDSSATCADGTNLHDLDPLDFENLCR